MLDSQLIALIQAQLIAGLRARGHSEIGVRRAQQPSQTSVPPTSTVFYSVASSKNYGWPARARSVDPNTGIITSTTTQTRHTRFTVAGLAASDATISSADIASMAAETLQHETALAAFIAADCNVLRVTDIAAIWFQDDKAQNRLWCPFDIVFSHKDVFSMTVPAITSINPSVQVIN